MSRILSIVTAALLFAAACAPADADSSVALSVSIDGEQLATLVYDGPHDRVDAFVTELTGALASDEHDSLVRFTVSHGSAVHTGSVALPSSGTVDLLGIVAPIAERHKFTLHRDYDDEPVNGIGSHQSELKRLCNADVCKELQCQYNVIDPRNCDLPVCTNRLDDLFNATAESCHIPGFGPACTLELCTPIGCYCLY